MLFNWQGISALYDHLQAERQLDQLVAQALPLILGLCREICGEFFFPTLYLPSYTRASSASNSRAVPGPGLWAAAAMWGR